MLKLRKCANNRHQRQHTGRRKIADGMIVAGNTWCQPVTLPVDMPITRIARGFAGVAPVETRLLYHLLTHMENIQLVAFEITEIAGIKALSPWSRCALVGSA